MKDETPTSIFSFLTTHPAEVALGLAAVTITIVLMEVLKPLIKLGLAKLGIPATAVPSILRSLTFFVASIPVLVLDFRGAWQIMTASEELMDLWSGLLLGCSFTWAGTQVTWLLFHDIRPIKALRVWLYKRIGITEEDIRQTRTLQTVTPPEKPDESSSNDGP